MGASVKIMLSYDYCHFEVALSSDTINTTEQANELRKHAQRLADEAVRQYRAAKSFEEGKMRNKFELDSLERKVKTIKENFPQSEWTSAQQATVKAYDDMMHEMNSRYDYEDDQIDAMEW
jgi:ABC-type transport system involved in Fe-S cluster assembly fused permease/ATPase subunit